MSRSLFLAAFGLFLAACNLVDGLDIRSSEDEGRPGHVQFDLTLSRNTATLAKAAIGDTIFSLDSLLIVLSSTNMPTQTYRYAISGRADLGEVQVSEKLIELSPLRTWKATFYSIDINGVKRDTVHLDSVNFMVHPAQTTTVQKNVSPAYAILKVRMLSTNAAQVPDSVRFVRLRVDGIVRDSAVVGSAPATATLNWVQAMTTGNVVHAAGNHGRVLRSGNSGSTWTEIILPGAPAVVSGHFVSQDRGYVLTKAGRLYHTTTGGVPPNQWNPAWIGDSKPTTADSVKALFMTETETGFAVGKNGGLYKTTNEGYTWFTMVSNTTADLNAVHFPTPDIGYVVGENETILRTTNGTASASTLPQNGGIVWAPIAGGWFSQTSNVTTDLRGIAFSSQTRGWAVGAGGTLLLTTNGGAVWESRNSNNHIGSANLNGVQLISSSVGFLVGDGGVFRKTDGNDWNWAPLHASQQSKLSGGVNLLALHFVNPDTGLAVGAGGRIFRTFNGRSSISDGPGSGGLTITEMTSGTTRTLRAVRFLNSSTAVAVGDSGTIRRTTNTGTSWTASTSGTSANLHDVRFVNANVGFAAGTGGTVLKTVDGGLNWSSLTTGTSKNLRTIQPVSADTIYAAGSGGFLLKTVNGGSTWYRQETPDTTTQLNSMFAFSRDYIWAVGSGGKILKAVNQGENWTGGGVKRALKGVYFVSVSTGWIVGDDGVILKTTDSARTWVEQHRQNGLMLHAVHFQNANVGWVTGANGEVFKTTDGGTTWNQQTTIVTTIPLTWISFRNTNEGFIIGGTNSLYTTANGGSSWTALFAGGTPGARTFDQMLAYKYLRPGQSHTITLEAIDRVSPLRGYQTSFALTAGAGQDTTIHRPLTACGGSNPACQTFP